MHLFDHMKTVLKTGFLINIMMNWNFYDTPEPETIYVARKLSDIGINFWHAKLSWLLQCNSYFPIPDKTVWKRLVCPAPDGPDGWSLADEVQVEVSQHKQILAKELVTVPNFDKLLGKSSISWHCRKFFQNSFIAFHDVFCWKCVTKETGNLVPKTTHGRFDLQNCSLMKFTIFVRGTC